MADDDDERGIHRKADATIRALSFPQLLACDGSARLKNCITWAINQGRFPFSTVGQYLDEIDTAEQQLLRIPNLGRKSARELAAAVQAALGTSSASAMKDGRSGNSAYVDSDRNPQSEGVATHSLVLEDHSTSLDEILAGLRINERAWSILHRRVGLRRHSTLEEIGRELELTRERVRQIESGARQYLSRAILKASRPLSSLESGDAAAAGVAVGANQRAAILHRLERELVKSGFSVANIKAVYQLIVILRTLPEQAGATWPRITFLACSLAPELRTYQPVAEIIEATAEAKRELSYLELTRRVLLEEGKPLHWREIVARAEAIGRRRNVVPGSLVNKIQASELFVRTDPGTYGLREWGLRTKQPNIKVVADFLAARRRPASFGEILQRIGVPAKIKSNSLKMSLDMHPRFYRSIDEEYGLRAWLPPREMQRLSTPRWKVEAADSFARVARAQERGFDVDGIVLRDIEGAPAAE